MRRHRLCPASPWLVRSPLPASADLFVYSNACPKTACPGPTIAPSSSSTDVKCGAPLTCKSCGASDNACLFSQTYGDGATCSGRVVKEKINFGDELVADAYVGLVEAASGGPGKPAFFTNASLSGIFGALPTAATSNFGGHSPLFALMHDNKLPSGMTLCLRPDGGSLILGESFDHTRTNYQWSKLTSRSLYTVKLNDIAMPRKGPPAFAVSCVVSCVVMCVHVCVRMSDCVLDHVSHTHLSGCVQASRAVCCRLPTARPFSTPPPPTSCSPPRTRPSSRPRSRPSAPRPAR